MANTGYQGLSNTDEIQYASLNPSSTFVSFLDASGQMVDWHEMIILNAVGEAVLHRINSQESDPQIRIEDLMPGYYFVSFTGRDGLLRYSRFVKI